VSTEANVRGSRKDQAPHVRRIRIVLTCSLCGNRNYRTTKNISETQAISLSKFCNHCNQHTVHIEGK
jgi:large subunit ribosomal protein L33